MIYIEKTEENRRKFLEIVRDIPSYDELKETAKRNVLDLLLLEQKGICPTCHRANTSKTAENSVGFTIEHFLPKSQFERLQIDYYNLYACCLTCNNEKGDSLLPAYFFDSRYDIRKLENWAKDSKIKHIRYDLTAEGVRIVADEVAAHRKEKVGGKYKKYDEALLLYATINIFDLNRDNLVLKRKAAYEALMSQLPNMSGEKLMATWQKLATAPNVEFLGMKLYWLWRHTGKKERYNAT